MMKVFLDVGAHIGQTLAAVLRYDFDRIVCFEPVPDHFTPLKKLADARTEIKQFGLWDKYITAPLYNIGTQGASLWQRPERPTTSGLCHFVPASAWLRENVSLRDTVWMKLNVEGAELDIITDLLDSGEMDSVDFLEIMWDAGKIPEIADRVDAVRRRLASLYGAPRVVSSKEVPTAPTSTGRVDNWLAMTGMVPRK